MVGNRKGKRRKKLSSGISTSDYIAVDNSMEASGEQKSSGKSQSKRKNVVSISGDGSPDLHVRVLKGKAICAPEDHISDTTVGAQRHNEEAGTLRMMDERRRPNRGFSLAKKNHEKKGSPTRTSVTISETLSRNSNRLFLQCNSLNATKKIWEFGKELGVTYEGDKEAIIQKFVEMEDGDKLGFSSCGVREGY